MNMIQKRYAIDRINTVLRIKEEVVRVACTKKLPTPSDSYMLRAVRNDELCLKKGAKITDKLIDAYDFSDVWVGSSFDTNKFENMVTPIRKLAAKIRDEIMLGSSDAALDMIQNFVRVD